MIASVNAQTVANARPEIAFEAFGVPVAIEASGPEVLQRVRAYLPPGWQPTSASSVSTRFSLALEKAGTYAVTRDGESLGGGRGLELDLALEYLDSQLRVYIGRKARDAIFVHAGVVAHRGRAIVLPAPSFAGKTTIVAALVRAGAIYYSDEFAVLDDDGLVHPYAKPLSVRGNGYRQTDHPDATLGGVAGDLPLPVGAIVVTTFKRGAQWNPQPLSRGAGALALVANAVPAKERPDEVMRATSRAARDAIVIESDRGEADEIAPLVLAELER